MRAAIAFVFSLLLIGSMAGCTQQKVTVLRPPEEQTQEKPTKEQPKEQEATAPQPAEDPPKSEEGLEQPIPGVQSPSSNADNGGGVQG